MVKVYARIDKEYVVYDYMQRYQQELRLQSGPRVADLGDSRCHQLHILRVYTHLTVYLRYFCFSSQP
jgi:hypothetical protein